MAFRILSFDGGGIRGVLSAVILQAVEQYIGQPLNQYFNLIAGTSTGSILAAAAAKGKTSDEIISLYQNRGKEIFPYTSLWAWQRLGLLSEFGLSAPKFSDRGLIEVLKAEIGDIKLSEINSTKLLITAYDTLTREPIVFKSWQKSKPWSNVPLWEAAVCSASAPAFFPAHLLKTPTQNYSLIDGGVGANNPTACAIAEALRLNHPISEIFVISIGTGNSKKAIPYAEARQWGMGQWVWQGRIIEVLFDASSGVHGYISQEVMSPPDEDTTSVSRYLRLQPDITKDAMDDATPGNIAELIKCAQQYLASNQDRMKAFIQAMN